MPSIMIEGVDIDRAGAAGVADAEIVHGVEGVGPDLNAGADFAELIRLFEHGDAAALVGEPQGRREPANAAAGDNRGWRGFR